MNSQLKILIRASVLGTTALALAGCAELKLGVGPFKAASVEVGPGGIEVKGPSAGPLKPKLAP